jgi:excinuclease ABC subunit A
LRNQAKGKTLYILNEPGNGLHAKDVEKLLSSLKDLTAKGHTLICIAQSKQFINSADWLVEIGPGRGKSGGKLMFEGSPALLSEKNGALSYSVLNKNFISNESHDIAIKFHEKISLRGVRTHNLKYVDVDIPKRKMTVVTGVSGSGKSSLVFDTLAAEATSRFNESMSAYSRSFLKQSNFAKLDFSSGLSPVLAISPTHKAGSLRSTVGTVTGLYDYYRLLFSRIGQCRGYEYTAQNFSFNHQSGACPHCNGLGVELVCNPEALIAKPELSVLNGALCGSTPGKYFGNPDGQFVAILKQAAKEMNLDVDKAYHDLDEESKNLVLYGSGEKVYELDWEFKTKTRTGIQHLSANWPGFCYYIEDEYRRKHTNKTSDKLQALMHEKPCSVCHGGRLKQELLEIELIGKNIVELSKLPISDALIFLENLISEDMSEIEMAVITEIVPRVTDLLYVLESLGLSYITTARSSLSLSGGEMQRVRLAGAFASRLYGVCYVLDEPGMGLHRKDIPALINILKTLVKQGNTVVVLEHDEQFIRAADNIIEMGPAAGINGGEIIVSGSLNDIMLTDTPTGRYLSKSVLPKPVAHQIVEKSFGVKGAKANNLKSIDVDFIRGGLVAVTGVSGSGKSSLLRDVLLASINNGKPVNCDSIYGIEKFDNILSVNQNSISANSLSTILTFTGLMDVVRDCFSKTDDARDMGLKKAAFSYINKEGKCPACGGMGVQKISMDFMSDVNLTCEYCNGTRYRPEVLLCNYKGRNIGEVLDFSVSEAAEFFADNQKLYSSFQLMTELGLGHVKIGQAGNTLSGGESQRLKLAAELIRSKKGKNLFLFDEPSAGLHHQDILALLKVFHRLASLGHTLVYVEHRSEMIAAANQQVCLGPGAGDNGGNLM